jgi:hypothetical protein
LLGVAQKGIAVVTKKHRRISLSLRREPALTVTRSSTKQDVLVYVFAADRKLKYPNGRSRIVYIGKTEKGIARVTGSASERADKILSEHGVYSFQARLVHYPSDQIDMRQTWHRAPTILLERALIIMFGELFDAKPLCNGTGHRMKPRYGEFDRLSRSRVKTIIEDLS